MAPQQSEHRSTKRRGNCTSRHMPQRTESKDSKSYLYTHISSNITSFMAAKRWKQLKRPSADEWINKYWYIHATEYYSALKTNEIETHCSLDEPWRHCAKGSKPDPEEHGALGSTSMTYLESSHS